MSSNERACGFLKLEFICEKDTETYRLYSSRCCGKTGTGGDGNVKIEKDKFRK